MTIVRQWLPVSGRGIFQRHPKSRDSVRMTSSEAESALTRLRALNDWHGLTPAEREVMHIATDEAEKFLVAVWLREAANDLLRSDLHELRNCINELKDYGSTHVR